MAENVQITPGSGVTIAADNVTDGTLGNAQVQYVKLMDGTIGGTTKAGVGPNGLNVVVYNFPVTQPVSLISVPLPTNAAQETGGNLAAILAAGYMHSLPNNNWVTATGATGAAVTATLPAVVGKNHCIIMLEIEAYTTAARTGSATPIVVTSTNLTGSPAWTFATAAAIGTTDTKSYIFETPFIAIAADTITTIVCPATTGIIWRVNVSYCLG